MYLKTIYTGRRNDIDGNSKRKQFLYSNNRNRFKPSIAIKVYLFQIFFTRGTYKQFGINKHPYNMSTFEIITKLS